MKQLEFRVPIQFKECFCKWYVIVILTPVLRGRQAKCPNSHFTNKKTELVLRKMLSFKVPHQLSKIKVQMLKCSCVKGKGREIQVRAERQRRL